MRLADVIDAWIGRVEIVLAGADEDFRGGQSALSNGDPLAARAAARRVLLRAPNSPLGLALLADACEAGGLEAELALTLEELAHWAPSRAEVWVRLGSARKATGASAEDVRDAFARGLGVAASGSDARRDALIGLADLDLSLGDAPRAELWLERAAGDHSPELAVRRAEARLNCGDAEGSKKLLEGVSISPTDGRAALVRGRTLAQLGDPSAFAPLVRAMVLDAPGASESLAAALAHLPTDPQLRTRLRSVVDAKGEQSLARWRAAFARAEGARDAARAALSEAVAAGDRAAARLLLDAALEDRDLKALEAALGVLAEDVAISALPDAQRLARAIGEDPVRALDTIAPIRHPACTAWADAIASDLAATLVPKNGAASWADLLGRLDMHAHALGDRQTATRVGSIATDISRPVRLAVVGEFNAGKSTFINALIGTDAAPTGILPTTSTVHHLRWAPDPFAKIIFADGESPSERIIPLAELRAAMKTGPARPFARIEIGMPLPALVRVEILDTPGFNAPDPRHTAIARTGLEEADIAIWLLDATQAMKASERAVLDQARAAGLPVALFVNKVDRLTREESVRVVEAVQSETAHPGLPYWSPPLAFSAKKALAGKLGDAKALAESGWTAVETALEERVVMQSAALKESSLRRRAASVAQTLLQAWKQKAAVDVGKITSAEKRARDTALGAAQIESNAEALAERLAESLAPHVAAFSHDVELILLGRDRETAERDPVLQRYRVDRALASLGPPLARALASLSPSAALSPADLTPSARAILRAAAWYTPANVDFMVAAIARAGIATLVDELFARAAGTAHQGLAEGVVRELGAFAAALA